MRTSLAAIGLTLLACGRESEPTGPSLAIDVAPLALEGVADAEYTLTVTNAGGAVVWTKSHVASRDYGAGGSLAYVGPCDASSSPNTVSLSLERLLDADGDDIASSTWRNPTLPLPLTQTVACTPNSDNRVTFALTIARDAQQGFFDIAVAFEDVFCSAKLDCVDALLQAPNDPLRRDAVVLALACVAGSGQPTYLYMSDVSLTCGTTTVAIDPTQGPGNLGARPLLYQAGVYRGHQTVASADSCYWNVALAIDPNAAGAGCTLSARATASSTPFADGHTPPGSVYPEIRWQDVPIGISGADLLCSNNPLDGSSSLVRTGYTSGDGFPYALACATNTVSVAGREVCDGLVPGVDQASVDTTAAGIVVHIGSASSPAYRLPGTSSVGECCAHACCTEGTP